MNDTKERCIINSSNKKEAVSKILERHCEGSMTEAISTNCEIASLRSQ
jgi:hypothetical protein